MDLVAPDFFAGLGQTFWTDITAVSLAQAMALTAAVPCYEADFQRLKASGIDVFHPAVGYVADDIYTASLRDITGWNASIAAHGEHFLRVDSPADLERAKAVGKIGIVIGRQNSEHFRTVGDVERFHDLGQRVSQLTYKSNVIGGGSPDPRDPGLSPYGAQMVERMNQVGMAVDVSH